MKQRKITQIHIDKGGVLSQKEAVVNEDQTPAEISNTLTSIVRNLGIELVEGVKVVHPESFTPYVYTSNGWIKDWTIEDL